jgi:5-(carboxyamino)imidazole ribonucleotide synthase
MTRPIIGILGGGQLGMMLSNAAKKIGIKTHIFCPEENCPASSVSDFFTKEDYNNKEAIEIFSEKVDYITYEFENIPIQTIDFIKNKKKIRPGKKSLLLTQDRLTEKKFLNDLSIPIAPYKSIETANDIKDAHREFNECIIKTRTLGYDGKGQEFISNQRNYERIFKSINLKSIIEKKIPFEFEVSVIIARDIENNLCHYPIGKNVHKNHILKDTFSPIQLTEIQINKLISYSEKIITELNHVGVLAVEFFVTEDNILVNEIAPRVHNSGHWTIDACDVSQFEQHILCVAGEKVKDPILKNNAHMINLIGDEINNWAGKSNSQNIKIHLYNKEEIKEGRKMGHVTYLFNKEHLFE